MEMVQVKKKFIPCFGIREKKSISKKCGTFPLSCTLATAETCDRIPHVELRQTHSNPFFFLFLNKSLFPHSSLYILFSLFHHYSSFFSTLNSTLPLFPF